MPNNSYNLDVDMPPFKRQKLSDESQDEHDADGEVSEDEESVVDGSASGSEADSQDELEGLKRQKSQQTKKRKIRASKKEVFGTVLQALLVTDAPSALPLSLKPSIARRHNDEKLEQRAKKVLQVEKKEKEDKGRISDVIGGWGGESERALRKVAQRGGMCISCLLTEKLSEPNNTVVKLFNVIQQAQASATVAAEETKAARGSGKPTLPAPTADSKGKGNAKGKNTGNIIGRGKEGEL